VFIPITPICAGQALSLPLISNNGTSGTWSPAVNNTQTTTYTFTPNPGVCALPATMTVEVNNYILPVFVQDTVVCMGSNPVALPTTSSNGISGTWSPANTNTQQTTNYTFIPNANQCVLPQ